METEETRHVRTVMTGPTTTLSRWSSEPASLSSGGDEAAATDVLERTRRSIAAMQHALAAERDRRRRLEAEPESSAKFQTVLTPTTLDAILRCLEQERSENRQLQGTVVRQHRTITKLRRQLRALQLRPTSDGSSVSSDDLDDNVSEMLSLHPQCSNCHRMVTRSQSDSSVSTISVSRSHSRPTANSAVTVAVDDPGRAWISDHTGDDDTETLRRRLNDTVETCQRLATALDARHRSPTTQDVCRTSSSQTTQHVVDVKKTINLPAFELPTTHAVQLTAIEARLKEVEEMNARWQGYVEQREQYTRALEQRCSELEQTVSQQQQQQQQQWSDEQQRRIDQILLDQRQKAELADEARLKAEAENRQLRSKLKQLTTIQDQNKVCIKQLLNRLQEVEMVRRSEQNTADALRQQVNAYREDFEGERLDRHRAQERVVNLERQVAALKLRLGVYESNASRSSSQRSRWWQDTIGDGDGSLPQLVARDGESSSFPGDPSPPLRPVTDPAPRSC